MNGINVRLWKGTVSCSAYGMSNLIVSADRKYFECLTELLKMVINKYVEPKDRSLGNTREHFRGWRINTVDSDKRITTSYVTKQLTDITIREIVGTELI